MESVYVTDFLMAVSPSISKLESQNFFLLFLFNSFITKCNITKCDMLLDGHRQQLYLELFFKMLSSKLLEIRIWENQKM